MISNLLWTALTFLIIGVIGIKFTDGIFEKTCNVLTAVTLLSFTTAVVLFMILVWS